MLLPEAALNEPSLAGGLFNREARPSAIQARLLPEGAKAEKIRIKTGKLQEAKADARKRGLILAFSR